jgi:hypothetical protein
LLGARGFEGVGKFDLSGKPPFLKPGFAGDRNANGFLVIDRRSFIAGAAATYFSTIVQASADQSQISRVGRGIKFFLDGGTWLVDPDLFGSSATVTYRWIDVDGYSHSTVPEDVDLPRVIAHEIELTNGRFPGLSIRSDFAARLYKRTNSWFLRIGFVEASGAEYELPFAGWANADPDRRVNYRSTYRGVPIIVGNAGSRDNRIESVRYAATLEIDALFNFSFSHEPNRGSFRYISPKFQFSAAGLTLTLTPSAPPRAHLPKNATGFSLLTFSGTKFRDGELPLGAIAGDLVAPILNMTLSVQVFSVFS